MRKPDERRGLKRGEGSWFERNGRYVARWIDDNGRHRGRTFDTIWEAEDHLREQYRKRQRGHAVSVSDLTVSGLIEEFLERAETRLSERTILNYRQRHEHMIKPHLGSRRIVTLETMDVQRWVTMINGSFAPATVNNAISVLTAALREAVVLGLLPRNPATGVRRPSIVREKYVTWSAEECGRFLATVAGSEEYQEIYSALYHTAIVTGMRPGELRSLGWQDVDLSAQIITVRRSISRNALGEEIIGRSTKTHRIRAVAITDELVELLEWHRDLQDLRRANHPHWQDHGLVFDRGDGHWIYQSAWQRAHRVLVDAAGVPYVTAHGLRHTSASLELEAGTHPVIVADRLGHKDVSMTTNMYQHTSVALQREAAAALSSRIFGAKLHSNLHSNVEGSRKPQ